MEYVIELSQRFYGTVYSWRGGDDVPAQNGTT